MTKQFDSEVKYSLRIEAQMLSGLIVISLIILQDLISLASLDLPAFISLIAFVLAIPFMAGGLLINRVENEKEHVRDSWLVSGTIYIGLSLAIVGIAAIIWHISWIAGIAFLASLIIASIIYIYHDFKIENPSIFVSTKEKQGSNLQEVNSKSRIVSDVAKGQTTDSHDSR